MRYAKIRKQDISNGPGTRVSLFTQGCCHHCKNCFNPETWDFKGGKEWTIEKENRIIELSNSPFIDGLSILGGDPFDIYTRGTSIHSDDDMLLHLIKRYKKTYPDKSIWLWTGYTWEQFTVNDMNKTQNVYLIMMVNQLLPYIDVIVDGEFIEDLKDPTLDYAGSTNQRVINVERSIKAKKVIPWIEP